MDAHAPATQTWVERSAPAPLPGSARFGFVLAVLTLLAAIAAVVRMYADGVPEGGGLFAAWVLLYAGGLAWGWLGLRPRPDRTVRMQWANAGLAIQALTYLAFWTFLAAGGTTSDSWLPEAMTSSERLRDILLGHTIVQFLFVGPFFAALAMSASPTASRMALVQGLGIAGFFFAWTLA